MNSAQQITVIFHNPLNRNFNVLKLLRKGEKTITQNGMYHEMVNLYHACSVTGSESKISLKDFAILSAFILPYSRFTNSITVRKFFCFIKWSHPSENIRRIWKTLLQSSKNPPLSLYHGFPFVFLWYLSPLTHFWNWERLPKKSAAIAVNNF